MSNSRFVYFYFTVSLFVYYNTYLTVVAEKSNKTNTNIWVGIFITIIIYFLVTLFDSTKLKEDLNWAKISFKDTSSQSFTKQKLLNENDSNKQTSKNDIYGVSYNL